MGQKQTFEITLDIAEDANSVFMTFRL